MDIKPKINGCNTLISRIVFGFLHALKSIEVCSIRMFSSLVEVKNTCSLNDKLLIYLIACASRSEYALCYLWSSVPSWLLNFH